MPVVCRVAVNMMTPCMADPEDITVIPGRLIADREEQVILANKIKNAETGQFADHVMGAILTALIAIQLHLNVNGDIVILIPDNVSIIMQTGKRARTELAIMVNASRINLLNHLNQPNRP